MSEKRTESLRARMMEWRRDLHAHPETSFEEHRTSELVASELRGMGAEVQRGLGRTGVVGVIRGQSEGPAIALRADMDALSLEEAGDSPHRSRYPGKMHACGHDGHTAMLLGAARELAATRAFHGSVVLVFQPAEEHGGGARAMMADGLFERFPVQAVFGMHNWPALAAGQFAIRAGAVMAAADRFEITVYGRGGHAGMPEQTIDPVVIGAGLVRELQTVVSRKLAASEAGVLSVTQFHAGDTWNVIPERAVLGGTVRTLSEEARDLIEQRLRRVCDGLGLATGARVEADYERGHPPTVNTAREAALAASVARELGCAVNSDLPASMAAEDFGELLQRVPGAFIWLGSGAGPGAPMLHSPSFDFNDEVLVLGSSYWVALAETCLAGHGAGSPHTTDT